MKNRNDFTTDESIGLKFLKDHKKMFLVCEKKTNSFSVGIQEKPFRAEAVEQDKQHEKATLRTKDTCRRKEKQSQVRCVMAAW